jgi:hypothetical protein
VAKVRRVEIVEIPVEALSYVPHRHAHGNAASSRWSGPFHGGSGRPHRSDAGRSWAVWVGLAPGAVGDAAPTFRRLIEIRGSRLGPVLGRWWEFAEHDDGHLRLDAPRSLGEAWLLTGTFRTTSWSRWLPVELLLSPRFGPWSLLELAPLRTARPNEIYFRVGHRSLDRFVAELRAYDVGAGTG